MSDRAMAYAKSFDCGQWPGYEQTVREQSWDAGYSAALSPPTPEEIEAALDSFLETEGVIKVATDTQAMAGAILAFLEGRKR